MRTFPSFQRKGTVVEIACCIIAYFPILTLRELISNIVTISRIRYATQGVDIQYYVTTYMLYQADHS